MIGLKLVEWSVIGAGYPKCLWAMPAEGWGMSTLHERLSTRRQARGIGVRALRPHLYLVEPGTYPLAAFDGHAAARRERDPRPSMLLKPRARKGRMLDGFEERRMDFKFTHTGKFLIAAGSQREGASDIFNPVLYISVLEDKVWATHYPMEGRYPRGEDAAAAALHYAIQIITRQKKDVKQPEYIGRRDG